MITAEKSIDQLTISKERRVFTKEYIQVPGLRMIGCHTIYDAIGSLNWHYHENAFEFSVPSKGSFSFVTTQKSYPFSLGDVFVSFPDEIHGTDQKPISLGELYWFQLEICEEEGVLFLSSEASRELIHKLKELPHHVIHTEVTETLPLITKAFEAAVEKNNQLTAAYLHLFLRLVISSIQRESVHISPNMQGVLEYIEEYITAEVTLEQLAVKAGLSCSQFKQNFKKELGLSPRHYINKRKIECAKELLLEGKNVTEAAMMLNFSSSNYFSSVFKKYTLCTPSEYVQKSKSDVLDRRKR